MQVNVTEAAIVPPPGDVGTCTLSTAAGNIIGGCCW